ncbi:unnamed protein product, partial [Prorocentrum cordatum]
MAPGATPTPAEGVAAGAPAARAGLRLAGVWLATVVAASATCPARTCQASAWPPPLPSPPSPPAGPGAASVAAALAAELGSLLANSPPRAPPICPSVEAVAAVRLEKLSLGARAEDPTVAAEPPVVGPHDAVEGPEQYYTWEGELRAVSEFRRRRPLRVTSGGVGGTATPPVADAKPLVEAAAADAWGAPRTLDPPDGRAWVVASPGTLLAGREEACAEGSVRLGAHHTASRDGESRRVAEAIPLEEADGHRWRRPRVLMNLLERLSRGRRMALEGSPESAAVPTAVGALDQEASDRDLRDWLDSEVADYVRTVWAQQDGRGEHCDRWREVVREVTRYIFRDWPLWDGLSTVEHMIKMGDPNGGNPLPWLEMGVRDRVSSSTDRACIGTKGLLSAINYAGSRAHISLASMMSIKVLCHMVSQIVEAYSNDPTKLPKWGGPRHYRGVTGPRGVIDPALRSAVFRRNTEEMELGGWKSRAAGVSAMSPLALEA